MKYFQNYLPILFILIFMPLVYPAGSAETPSTIRIDGATISSTGCGYYSFDYFQAEINYQNTNLHWGSRVEILYGFHDLLGSHNEYTHHGYWVESGKQKLVANAPYTWSYSLPPTLINSKGHFLNTFEFVFKITTADGSVSYDNGNLEPMGYYGIYVPRVSCREIPLFELPLERFRHHDPREVKRD